MIQYSLNGYTKSLSRIRRKGERGELVVLSRSLEQALCGDAGDGDLLASHHLHCQIASGDRCLADRIRTVLIVFDLRLVFAGVPLGTLGGFSAPQANDFELVFVVLLARAALAVAVAVQLDVADVALRANHCPRCTDQHAGEEPADVRPVRNSTTASVLQTADAGDQLHAEPGKQKPPGADDSHHRDDADHDQRFELRLGEEDEIRAENGGDRATSAEGWSGAGWVGEHVHAPRRKPAEQVEQRVFHGAHAGFDRPAERLEEDHVAEQVSPAAMEKHGGTDAEQSHSHEPRVAGSERGAHFVRHYGPCFEKRLHLVCRHHQFDCESKRIDDDENDSSYRESPTAEVVLPRNHGEVSF